ncbi:MAG: serine/threonine protein kinase [Clostridia bacterium]|nr:serine/threonine protein kinase [Clostridia bacterium]
MDISYYKKFEPIDGKWFISKEIGSGAFGTVFEIERKDFADMKAALKVVSIPSSQSEFDSFKEENYDLDEKSVTSYFYGFVEEFVKEFRLMSQLKGHSNIVSYEDHDVKEREDGVGWDIFIRMELLTPMNKYFANNIPKKSDIIKLGIDICKALEVCQKYNIIHRDIKPSNIFVSQTGDFKLGDFGVARTLEKTSSGLSKKGTYTYMAPEVFKGEKYNSNVDIYSLGIVMYKLLNNNLEPFRTDRTYSDSEKSMELRMGGAAIPAPANASGRLAEIVLKACSFDPGARYESPIQMREELESILYSETERPIIYPDGDTVDYEPSVISTEGGQNRLDEDGEKTVSIFSNVERNIISPEVAEEESDPDRTVSIVGASVSAKAVEPKPEPVMPKADKKEPDPKKEREESKGTDKPKNKLKWLIPVIAVLLLIVVGVVVFFGISGNGEGTKTNQEANFDAVSEELSNAVDVMPDDCLTIEFQPDIGNVDLEQTSETIAGRANVLGVPFKVIAEQDRVTLQIAKDFSKTNCSQRAILDLISSSGDISLVDYYSTVEKCNEGITNIVVESDSKDQFLAKYGHLLTVDTDTMMRKLSGATVYYLRVTFDEATTNRYQECLGTAAGRRLEAFFGTYENVIRDGDDYISGVGGGEILENADGNSNQCFIVPAEFADEENAVKLLKYIIENDTMGSDFSYQCKDEIQWETDLSVRGVNQVDDLDGNYIVVEYHDNGETIIGDSEFANAVQAIKARIDVLGVPYSIGYKGLDQKTLVLKINPENISSDMIRMFVRSRSVEFYTQNYQFGFPTDSIQLMEAQDGSRSLQVDFTMNKDYIQNEVSYGLHGTYVDGFEIPTGTTVYLVVNDVTVASTDLSTLSEDGMLYFNNLMCANKDAIEDADMAYALLVEHIGNEYNHFGFEWSLEDISVQYYTGSQLTDSEHFEIPWKYNAYTEVDHNVKQVVEQHGAKFSKAYHARNAILIEFDMDVNVNFVSRLIEKFKTIYTDCGFDGGAYAEVVFVVKGAGTGNPEDKGLIGCQKNFGELKILDVSLTGPTLGAFSDEMTRVYYTDEFFSARNH